MLSAPLEMNVVTRDEIGDKRKDVNHAIAKYEEALNTRRKFHEREQCIRQIADQWAKIDAFVVSLVSSLDPAPIANLDRLAAKSAVSDWETKKKGSLTAEEEQLFRSLTSQLDHFDSKSGEWSVLPPAESGVTAEMIKEKKRSHSRNPLPIRRGARKAKERTRKRKLLGGHCDTLA